VRERSDHLTSQLAAARLYLCTDARERQGDLPRFLDDVLAGGVDIVQLRQKGLEAGQELRYLEVFRRACDAHGVLLAVQRPNGDFAIPAGFLDGDQVLHGLGGTLTLLFDCGFSDTEALSWLFTADDSLPGTPVQALAEHRRTEVNRRAQALAF